MTPVKIQLGKKLSSPIKFTLASKGPLEDTAAYTRCGYFSLSQAAKEPGYDPPKAIQRTLLCSLYLSFIALIKLAKSAKA